MATSTKQSPFDKYQVTIGSFYYANAAQDIEHVKEWCKNNLFLETSSSKIQPISGTYPHSRASSKSLTSVCKAYKIDTNDTYKGLDSDKNLVDFPLSKSFICQRLFKEASASSEDETFDNNRFSVVEGDMKHHPGYHDVKDSIDRLRNGVLEYAAKKVDESFSCALFTVLFSTEGGGDQDLHVDELRALDNNDEAMASAILALEDGTKLDFGKKVGGHRETLFCMPGAFFLFHGLQVHGGCSYSQSNLRLHFYLFKNKEVRDEHYSNGSRAVNLKCGAPLNEEGTVVCECEFTNEPARKKHVLRNHPAWYPTYKKKKKDDKKRVYEEQEPARKARRKEKNKEYEKNRRDKIKKEKEKELADESDDE